MNAYEIKKIGWDDSEATFVDNKGNMYHCLDGNLRESGKEGEVKSFALFLQICSRNSSTQLRAKIDNFA